MKLYDDMPFQRGETYFGPQGKIDPEAGRHLIGREYIHQDQSHETGALVRVRICKNVSGIKLIPGKLVAFQVKAGRLHGAYAIGHATDGYRQETAVVDDLLLSTVPRDDLFYLVLSGPCLAYPSQGPISVGEFLHPHMGGNPTSTDLANSCGRVQGATFECKGIHFAAAMRNVVGRAMSARPVGNELTDRILIQAGFGTWS